MKTKPDVDQAYALSSPEDNRALYAEWADSYDSAFAGDMDYQLPFAVAQAFVAAKGTGPVLDIGAGTGLCALALGKQNITQIDGVDISAEMLQVAAQKGLYRATSVADLTLGLDMPDDTYAGAVSSGTFTRGHLGPDVLDEVIRVVSPGGVIALSVSQAHFVAAGFERYFEALPSAARYSHYEVPIYGLQHKGTHSGDMAMIVTLRAP